MAEIRQFPIELSRIAIEPSKTLLFNSIAFYLFNKLIIQIDLMTERIALNVTSIAFARQWTQTSAIISHFQQTELTLNQLEMGLKRGLDGISSRESPTQFHLSDNNDNWPVSGRSFQFNSSHTIATVMAMGAGKVTVSRFIEFENKMQF